MATLKFRSGWIDARSIDITKFVLSVNKFDTKKYLTLDHTKTSRSLSAAVLCLHTANTLLIQSIYTITFLLFTIKDCPVLNNMIKSLIIKISIIISLVLLGNRLEPNFVESYIPPLWKDKKCY